MKKDIIHKQLKYKNIKDDIYLISEYGDVYSLARNRYLTFGINEHGYLDIALQNKDGNRGTYTVHTLVNNIFNGKYPADMIDPTTDHIDGNEKNNHYSNLRWLERGVNSATRKIKPKGEINGSSVITEKQAINICERLQNNESVTSIAKSMGVSKYIVSGIKTRRTWTHISNRYNFEKRYQMKQTEREVYKQQIFELFKNGYTCKDLVNIGYPSTSVYRYYKEFGTTGKTKLNE